MKSDLGISPRWKWAIAALATVAAGLSVWLTVEKLNGSITTLAGCGGGSDCANVLGSRWSMVLGVVPVSVLSSLLYLGVLTSLGTGGAAGRWFRRLAAWVVIAAAVWFTILQVGVIGSLCKYCMTMHGVGVLMALAILAAESGKVRLFIRQTAGAAPVALALVAGMAAIQHFGPQPPSHRIDQVDVDISPGDIHGKGDAGRVVQFFDGKKAYRVDALPHIGPVDADHVVVKYYDYTCDACRSLHAELDGLLEKYRGQLAVVLLPVPLNRDCNPNLPTGVNDHEKACEFASLALRVWRADPEKFRTFHDWLFENREVPVMAAEAMAASLVGESGLPAENDPWTAEILRQNVKDYKAFSQETPVLPKLLIKGAMIMQGAASTSGDLETLLKKELPLR